jgi:4-hydroxybenzoate polyprenyltransferase
MGVLKGYLDLCRVSNLPTVWTNVLAAGLLATGRFEPEGFLLLAAALSAFYLGGMSLNDICDLAHDRERRPNRPIPSGRVTLGGAWRLTVALFAAGLALLAVAPHPLGVAAGLVLLAAIAAYDLRHKGNPWSVLLMASCRLLVFVVVALALTGDLPLPVLAAGAVQFVYVLAISLVARRENRRPTPYHFPVVPAMLAGISLLDGALLALLVSPAWLAAGMAGSLLTWAGQRYVRGD